MGTASQKGERDERDGYFSENLQYIKIDQETKQLHLTTVCCWFFNIYGCNLYYNYRDLTLGIVLGYGCEDEYINKLLWWSNIIFDEEFVRFDTVI